LCRSDDPASEDTAANVAAILFTAALGRAFTITQVHGSQIIAGPQSGGRIEIGGRVGRYRNLLLHM